MFLKRLEIIGFKSFAERIGIDFVPGVTAIVGPNGSGKSNITDAIRWVLGEQSAKSLRGAKMEDVIFAGSDSRKSLNFAEVTLILDNSKGLFPLDYTEISVSRRVFRSGESVYLLNGQQCRLKDIQNVFMDSGLGKEAFSIISQGRVDEILNSKPEDRRSIFDEAAGVLKYKTRKRQASFKLIETEDNLDRVLDILKELDDRLEPLRKNAEAAKKYEVLSEQIRAADVQLLNYESMSLQQKIAQEATAIQAIEKRKETIEQDVLQVERQATQTKEQLAKLDQFLDEQQQQLMDVRTEIEKWEGRRLLSDEKRRNNEQQLARILKEIATVEQESVTIRQRLSVSTQSYEKTTDALQQVAEEIDHISNMLKRSAREIEKEIDELKTVYIDRLNEEATVRNDLKHLDDRIANEQQSSERILQQTTLLQQQLQRLQNEKKERQQHVQSLQQQATSLQKMIDQANSELKEKEAILANEQQMLQKALNRQHEMQGRVRVLQSLEEDFSGFYSGVREVLIARKQKKLQGIDGAVAELITVDPVHTKAIEVALGGAMQHIITETEANARQAINYLKMKNAGRATFLPRNIMKARQIPASLLHQVRQQSEFVGTADQLIQTDVNYRHIIGNLLGQTMVAETLEGATALAKKIGYRYRIVTLDGDLVNAGGSLTGGGVKSQTTVFSRKAELEALKKQLSKMSRSIEGATTKVSESKMMVARLMQDTDSMRSQFEAIQRDKAIADSRLQETIMEIRTVESEITTSEIGRRGAQSASSELLEKQRQLQENHQLLKAELETIQQSVTTLERLASDRRNEEATLLQKMTTLREQAATLKTEKAFHKSTIQQAKTTLQQLEQRLDMLQQEQQIMEGHEQSIELTPEELQQRLYNCQQTQRQIENTVTMKRAERSELATLLQQFEQQLSQLRQEMEEIHHTYREKTVELSKLEVKFESVTQHLLEEYGLYPDDSAFVPFNVEETRVRVEMLKRERDSLGTINPSSIEEYEEVSERYHFLTEQRNDLLEAKQTLNQAMSEMDREMETRFETTFKAVRARFHHVFKEMFGGGDADLILTTPDNLLETGVEIVARPPGKKLQSLSLLSGGERALTAITLLFAIIEVRPVPFVILDEVEAALDEANVLRYSNYLKRFSDQTQFIVITHRKGTMEGADVLYGVTMQESGVSKLISVKLSEVPVEAMK